MLDHVANLDYDTKRYKGCMNEWFHSVKFHGQKSVTWSLLINSMISQKQLSVGQCEGFTWPTWTRVGNYFVLTQNSKVREFLLEWLILKRNVGNPHLCHRSDRSNAHQDRWPRNTDFLPRAGHSCSAFSLLSSLLPKSKGHCLLVPMAAVAKPSLLQGTDRQTGVWSWTERGDRAYTHRNKRVCHAHHTRDALHRWSRIANRIVWSPFQKKIMTIYKNKE